MAKVRVGGGSSASRAGTLRPQGTYAGTFNPASGLPTIGTGRNGAIVKGDWWLASGAGTIASLSPFTTFAAGDTITALVNNADAVGEFVGNKGTGGSGGGDLLAANNLSDVANTTTSFNNISGLTTLGDTIYGGASGTRSRLAGNTSTWRKKLNQVGNGSASAAPVWVNDKITIVMVAGNQTTTSATAQAVTELITGTLEANCRYVIHGFLHTECDNTGGVKIAFDVPAGASIWGGILSRTSSATGFSGQNITADATLIANAFNTQNAQASSSVWLDVTLGATAGTIQLMFASGTGGQLSTLHQAGTFLIVEKITA